MEPLYWLILLVILMIIEFVTMGLTTIWFAAGSLAAFLVSLFTPKNLVIQIIVFILVSFILLIVTRPIAMKYLSKRRIKTNYETFEGMKVKVISDIDNLNEEGQVVLNGVEWTARSTNDNLKYKAGDIVTVRKVSGVKLIVDKGENEECHM